ncbi:hypothetical protein R69746_08771 [Paraburkholderia aspalathi]|nr:hypothetical protein R69746_08771 [Paraburkholderia aspalathi]
MRQVRQCSQHLAGLVRIVVDGLLAEDHQLRLFLVDQRLEQLGDGQRLQVFARLDQDRAVRADCQRRAQRFLRLLDTRRHGDHFGRHACFAQTHGFFNRDFVERIHRHFHVRDVDARAVRFDPDFHVVVDDPLDCHQYLQSTLLHKIQPSSQSVS